MFIDGSLCVNMEHKVEKLDGQWRKSTGLPTSWSAQRMVPCRSRSQCSDVSCGQNCGHCGRPPSCRSQERRSFLIVQRCSEAWNVDRNGAQQREGHMLTCGDESGTASETLGDEAHIDSVSKCKAHLSKAEQAKLDEAARLTTAGNAWADELAKEEARDDSFQSILYDTYTAAVETSTAVVVCIGSFILRAKGGERWSRRLRDGTRRTSDGNVHNRFRRVFMQRGAGDGNDTARRVASTQAMLQRRQHWLGQNVCGIRQRHWENTRGPSVISWLRRAASCGAAGVEREQPSSQRSLASRVWGIRELKNMREACCRAAGIPRKTVFLDDRSWSQNKHGHGGGKATKGTTVTGLFWPSSDNR